MREAYPKYFSLQKKFPYRAFAKTWATLSVRQSMAPLLGEVAQSVYFQVKVPLESQVTIPVVSSLDID